MAIPNNIKNMEELKVFFSSGGIYVEQLLWKTVQQYLLMVNTHKSYDPEIPHSQIWESRSASGKGCIFMDSKETICRYLTGMHHMCSPKHMCENVHSGSIYSSKQGIQLQPLWNCWYQINYCALNRNQIKYMTTTCRQRTMTKSGLLSLGEGKHMRRISHSSQLSPQMHFSKPEHKEIESRQRAAQGIKTRDQAAEAAVICKTGYQRRVTVKDSQNSYKNSR